MKVTVDFWRLVHLATLLLLSYAGGRFLISQWEMSSALSAYAISCFVICQISNILLKILKRKEEEAVIAATAPAQKITNKRRPKGN
jgi:hypothetical protein